MSVLVGTDAYSLAGLQGVGGSSVGTVPRLAVSGALGLALLSVAMLVFYVGHMTDAIRIDTIMRRVEQTARRLLQCEHPRVSGESPDPDAAHTPRIPGYAVTLAAPRGGYLQGIDVLRLVPILERHDLDVRLLPLLGYHVVEGEPPATVWHHAARSPTTAELDAVAAASLLLPERLAELDIGFDIRQLVDMANRAMGTTQNDPYTAVQAVHHLTAVLADAARRSFTSRQLLDDASQPRVTIPIMDFLTHLRVVCSHVRKGGLRAAPQSDPGAATSAGLRGRLIGQRTPTVGG
jgi:uncharacterized membrane protein